MKDFLLFWLKYIQNAESQAGGGSEVTTSNQNKNKNTTTDQLNLMISTLDIGWGERQEEPVSCARKYKLKNSVSISKIELVFVGL